MAGAPRAVGEHLAALEPAAGGAVLVRYAWAAVPFQYKAAGLYAEGLPAGPFVTKAKAASQ